MSASASVAATHDIECPRSLTSLKKNWTSSATKRSSSRLAAAVWVDDKRAAVLRYLEEKKLGRKKAAQSGELEIARSAKEAAWAAVDVAKDAQRTAKLALTIAGVAAAAAIAAAALAAVIAYLKP